ncbi:MAG: CBS domain-containing protein [Gemmatimonadaceae bacterium]
MRAQDLMTLSPACVTPDDDVRKVAQLMADNDCGCVPVVDTGDNRRVLGVITDRDIAIRGIAMGKGPHTKVSELMTREAECCLPDDEVSAVERVMADKQVRRVVIVDDDGYCVGIVAQADLARATKTNREVTERDLAHVIERISEPATPPNPT